MSEWRKHGACCDAGPTVFFPISNGPGVEEAVEAAKAICRGCSVLPQCTIATLLRNPSIGVWAGMTPDEITAEIERRKMREGE